MDQRERTALLQFSRFCQSINLHEVEELFQVSESNQKCTVCDCDSLGVSGAHLLHMRLLLATDKHAVHGIGESLSEAKEDAARKALELLRCLDGEIFELRKQRLRLRLADFGITVPKTSAMKILENEENSNHRLPLAFVALVKRLVPEEEEEEEGGLVAAPKESFEHASEAFLLALSSMSNSEANTVFCKLGLTLCDELNAHFNPFLFSALVTLFLRLDVQTFGRDEKLSLSFCKLMEQVLILNGDRTRQGRRIVGRLIRFFIAQRAIPFMSKNRMEALAVQLTSGGLECMLYQDSQILKGWAADEEVLKKVVASKSPNPEYLASLHEEFQKVNIVIKRLFGVDGEIYGSLVNGFPTNASDIDVVINLAQDAAGEVVEELGELGEVDSKNVIESSLSDSKNLIELNQLFEALTCELGPSDWTVAKIETARVPILVCKRGPVEVNISFNHRVVIANSALLAAYGSISPKVRELVVLVKHWAKQREVNDSLQGTLSSYAYVLLVVEFLQSFNLLPNLQAPPAEVIPHPLPEVLMDNGRCSAWFLRPEDVEFSGYVTPFKTRLESASLKFLFVRFCERFLYKVNYVADIISIGGWCKPGSKKREYFLRETHKIDAQLFRRRAWFTIADPFETGRYLGTSARGSETLVKEMVRAIDLTMEGAFEELFKKYSRSDRQRLPPCPVRELNKGDAISYSVAGLKLKFDPREAPEFLGEGEVSEARNFCYMSRFGLPSEAEVVKYRSVGSGFQKSGSVGIGPQKSGSVGIGPQKSGSVGPKSDGPKSVVPRKSAPNSAPNGNSASKKTTTPNGSHSSSNPTSARTTGPPSVHRPPPSGRVTIAGKDLFANGPRILNKSAPQVDFVAVRDALLSAIPKQN